MIKIIHSADMHLDAPMSSRGRRKSELMADFKSLIDISNNRGADILLISGDLFDSPYPDDSCVKETINILSLCNARVFISPGNHDPYTEDSVYAKYTFPENVHIFTSPEVQCISTECGADVYGYAFTSSAKKRQPLPRVHDLQRVNLFSIHGDLGVADSIYCPVFVADIEMTGADYVALGHIHKASNIAKIGKTSYGYSGCLSSKDFGECGKKGAIYGEFHLENGVCHSHFEFISLESHQYEIVEINVTQMDTMHQLYSKLSEIFAREGFGSRTSVRIIFKGEKSDDILLTSSAFEDPRNKVFELEFEDRTIPRIIEEELEKDPAIRGELYRILKPMLESDEEKEVTLARLALRMALGAIDNKEILDIPEMEDVDI